MCTSKKNQLLLDQKNFISFILTDFNLGVNSVNVLEEACLLAHKTKGKPNSSSLLQTKSTNKTPFNMALITTHHLHPSKSELPEVAHKKTYAYDCSEEEGNLQANG